MAESKKPKESPIKRLADAICKNEHFARDPGGKLCRFVDGAYRGLAERTIKGRVKRLCIDWKCSTLWSSKLANEVVEFIAVDAPFLWDRPPMDVLNVGNGLLRIADRMLLPHTPDHLSSVQLPVRFDPAATCPAIEAFVDQTFPADAHNLAWEVCGWLMRPDASIQKSVLLDGGGANGKSTWLNMVIQFLGKPNTSAVSLHKLEADRFAVARLVGKLANICADLPSEHLKSTSVFKALTGNDSVSAEYKFCGSFDYEPFARLVFSANHPPQSQDGSHAFFRRWLVIPFARTFEPDEQIPRDVLDAKLTAPGELSGLLNKALDALPRLKEQRGFSEPESVREAWSDFHATTDPLAVWLDQFTIDDPNAGVRKADLLAAYNADCERKGRPRIGKTPFGLALKKLRPTVFDAQRTIGGHRQWAYCGIGLLNYSEIDGAATGREECTG